MDERKHMRISATTEGNAIIAEGIGKKINVSEFELTVLCTLAEIGFMTVIAEEVGEEISEEVQTDRRNTIEAARKLFGKGFPEEEDGINSMLNAAAAILRREKFQKYIACD